MAKTYFQAKVTLNSATPTNGDNTEWECAMVFTDFDGSFTGLDILVGDIIAFDTSSVETGTFTMYEVISTPTLDLADITLGLRYATTNNNDAGPPDLSWIVGQDGVISRPSGNYGLLPVVSRDIQLISDKFTEYVQNYNFSKIVDNVNLIQRVNGETLSIPKGAMVYISETTNEMLLAHANDGIEKARVAGVVMSTTGSTLQGVITCDGTVEQPTTAWDALTGDTGGLVPNKAYFLSSSIAGGLTQTPPSEGFITRVGRALSSTILDVNLEPPIML